MKEIQVDFNFQARYYKSGEINEQTKGIWFVLHGYGQLAQYFLRKFRVLEENNICVIAPEGLSRFYLEPLENSTRKNNRVGATWMTRENREMDIQNYIHYLDTIYEKEIINISCPITLLGFSQGSATASRWILNQQSRFDRLILWAGIFPPDMNFEAGSKNFANKEIKLVYGLSDPFLNDTRFTEMSLLSEKLGVQVSPLTFDGGHDIDEGTLRKLI